MPLSIGLHYPNLQLTYGFVESIDLTVTVDYGSDVGPRTLINQIGLAPDTTFNTLFADHGDSGSIVVNDNIEAMGLLFATSNDGHAVANPMQAGT